MEFKKGKKGKFYAINIFYVQMFYMKTNKRHFIKSTFCQSKL